MYMYIIYYIHIQIIYVHNNILIYYITVSLLRVYDKRECSLLRRYRTLACVRVSILYTCVCVCVRV